MAKQPANGRKAPTEPQKPAKVAAPSGESAVQTAPVIDAIPAEVHSNAEILAAPPSEKDSVSHIEKPEKAALADEPAPAKAVGTDKTGKTGFLPFVLGGLVSGAIGAALVAFVPRDVDSTLASQVSQQAAMIEDLQDRISAFPAVDVDAILAAQTELESDISDLEASVSTIVTQVSALEQRPAGSGTSAAASDVEAEMDALRAQITEMTGVARTELEQARAAAAAIEENAVAAARDAAARAALARVQTALESGAPIGAALADLEEAIGSSAPDALLAVQEGVPTLGSLQEAFPEFARAALATARSEGVSGEETTGFGAFLRNQLDVRSTSPREGNSADAILSRAEAAMRGGRLADALSEISALPEVARAQMSDWLAQAEARADALAAVDILSSSISDN